jgi:hypothetical protein
MAATFAGSVPAGPGAHQPRQAHLPPQPVQEHRPVAHLDDPRPVHAAHAGVLEDLVVHLADPRLLHHRLLAARQERPEGAGLRLHGRVRVEGEVDLRDVPQVGVAGLVGDPDLVQYGTLRHLPQHPVDRLGALAGPFRRGHQVRGQGGLHHHLLADGRLHVRRHLLGEARPAGQQPRQVHPLHGHVVQERLPRRSRQHQGRQPHRRRQQGRDHKDGAVQEGHGASRER